MSASEQNTAVATPAAMRQFQKTRTFSLTGVRVSASVAMVEVPSFGFALPAEHLTAIDLAHAQALASDCRFRTGEVLRFFRHAVGFDQQQLADRIGFRLGTVRRAELPCNRSVPDLFWAPLRQRSAELVEADHLVLPPVTVSPLT